MDKNVIKSLYKDKDVICNTPGDTRAMNGYSGAFCPCGSVLHIKTPRRKDMYSIECPKCGYVVGLYCGKE